jgi:hypothetical protein
MVNLGYMLPTDEKHEVMIKEIQKEYERSIEEILNKLIEDEYKKLFGEEDG